MKPPASFEADLTEFRARTEAEVAGPTGPLAAVASHYVTPSHALSLVLQGGRLVAVQSEVGGEAAGEDESEGSQVVVRLAVEEAGIECSRGCGPGSERIDTARELQVGAHRVGLSPQSGGLRVLVFDPASAARAAFEGLHWAAPDPTWWRQGRLAPAASEVTEQLATTRGLTKPMRLAGTLEVGLPGGKSAKLRAYEAGPATLLVPFTDPSNGRSSYDAGRYLTLTVSDLDAVVVDFNRATNPWCAYSEHYNCPIPPAGNHVSVDVAAGEQRYH